jgi:hypothetical protein
MHNADERIVAGGAAYNRPHPMHVGGALSYWVYFMKLEYRYHISSYFNDISPKVDRIRDGKQARAAAHIVLAVPYDPRRAT